VVDGGLAHAIHLSYRFPWETKANGLSDAGDITFSQPAPTVGFPLVVTVPAFAVTIFCVFLGSSGEQVLMVAAHRVVAVVTNVKPIWNCAVVMLVGNAMSPVLATIAFIATAHADQSMPPSALAASPLKTWSATPRLR
jgi:hypothetical protein